MNIMGVPDGFWVSIDGQGANAAQKRYELAAGYHVVQVGAKPGRVQYGRSVEINPERGMTLDLSDKLIMPKVTKKPSKPRVDKKPPKKTSVSTKTKSARKQSGERRTSRALAWAGGAAAVLGLAQFGVAHWADRKFMNAPSDTDAQPYAQLNHATIIGGATASTVGGGLIIGAVVQGKW